jgi:phosphoglycerate dehydrogenase-like enzyme
MMQIQILYQPYAEAPEDLAALLDPGISVKWGNPLQGGENFNVLVAGRPSLEQLRSSSAIQALIIPFAGIPGETRELLLEHFPNLAVYNLHHNAIATAEMAMALLLATAKNLIPADRAIREHDWRIRYQPNQNIILNERTVLILGYGAVGKNIARMCRAFGMDVHAIRRNESSMSGEIDVNIHAISALDGLLPRSDIIFVALPLTPNTEGLLNQDRIAKLPKHCILVNVARGAVVEEKALYDALRTGSIAGAGIDVWYRYPEDEGSRGHTAPATFPFHELENVVMSPHRGGGSRQNESMRLRHLATLINTLGRGETTPTRVDVQEGY